MFQVTKDNETLPHAFMERSGAAALRTRCAQADAQIMGGTAEHGDHESIVSIPGEPSITYREVEK